MQKNPILEASAEIPTNIHKCTDDCIYHSKTLLEVRRMSVLMDTLLEKAKHAKAISFNCDRTSSSFQKVKHIFKEIFEEQHPYLELVEAAKFCNSCSTWGFVFKVSIIIDMWNKKTDIEKAKYGDISPEVNYIAQLCRFPKSSSSEYHIYSHSTCGSSGYQALVVDGMEIRIHNITNRTDIRSSL